VGAWGPGPFENDTALRDGVHQGGARFRITGVGQLAQLQAHGLGGELALGPITDDALPDPGRVWGAAVEVYPVTGLVPFLLTGLGGGTGGPGIRPRLGR
jgi:hypothetical protein